MSAFWWWIANYTEAAVPSSPIACGLEALWQKWADNDLLGVFFGIAPPPAGSYSLDIDVFDGTEAQFLQWTATGRFPV